MNGASDSSMQKLSNKKITIFYIILISLLVLISFAVFKVYKSATASVYKPTLYSEMYEKREAPLNYSLIRNWKGIDHTVAVNVNSVGVRDREWGQKEDEKKLRILILGDSMVFGVSVTEDKLFPKKLEEKLTTKNIPTRVFSAGVPGWNTQDEIQFVRHYWDLIKPDVVVLCVLSNDFDDSISVAESSHQLGFFKKPFEENYRFDDHWVMEAFASSEKDLSKSKFTVENLYKNSGKVDFFYNASLQDISETGDFIFTKFENNLRFFSNFLKEKNSKLLIVNLSTHPGSKLDKKTLKIYDLLGVPGIDFSHWTGDFKYYMENYANLPIDAHGNEKFHTVLSSVIESKLQEMTVVNQGEIKYPERIEDSLYSKMAIELQSKESDIISSIGSTVSFSKASSFKQMISMGGAYSLSRYLFKPETDSNSIIIEPLEILSAEQSPALFIKTKSFKGFVPCKKTEKGFRALLPEVIPKGKLVEVAFIPGYTVEGIFYEFFPVREIKVMNTDFSKEDSYLIDNIITYEKGLIGLDSDKWMRKSFQIELLSDLRKEQKLVLNLNSMAPADLYPIHLTLSVESLSITKKILSAGEHEIEFLIPKTISSQSQIKIESEKTFVPHDRDPKNLDTRDLSFLIQKFRVK